VDDTGDAVLAGPGRPRKNRRWDSCDSTPDCSPDCPDCSPDCSPDCPDCSLFLLPGLILRLLATGKTDATGTAGRPTGPPRTRPTGPGRAGMLAIRGYQRWLSPHLPTRCRQVPTCSNYGLEAVRRYGLVAGSRLTAARIRRCNPATPRGTADPVP
jgi:uncharacterized protein